MVQNLKYNRQQTLAVANTHFCQNKVLNDLNDVYFQKKVVIKKKITGLSKSNALHIKVKKRLRLNKKQLMLNYWK